MKRILPSLIAATALVAGAVVFFSADATSRASSERTSVPFEFSKSGHQIVTFVHEGRRVRFLLDTGSDGNLISAKAAARLGLRIRPGAGRASWLGRGSLELAAVDTPFAVSASGVNVVLRDVRVLEMPFIDETDEPLDGLLGSPFFRTHKAGIDFENGRLTFDPKTV